MNDGIGMNAFLYTVSKIAQNTETKNWARKIRGTLIE